MTAEIATPVRVDAEEREDVYGLALGDLLQELRDGELVDALEGELRTLVRWVVDVGAKGALQMTITVTPDKDDRGWVNVSAVHRTTLPQIQYTAQLRSTRAGGLTRQLPMAGL